MMIGELSLYNIELMYFLLKIVYFVKVTFLSEKNSEHMKEFLENFLKLNSSILTSYEILSVDEKQILIKFELRTESGRRGTTIKVELGKPINTCATLITEKGHETILEPLEIQFQEPTFNDKKENNFDDVILKL